MRTGRESGEKWWEIMRGEEQKMNLCGLRGSEKASRTVDSVWLVKIQIQEKVGSYDDDGKVQSGKCVAIAVKKAYIACMSNCPIAHASLFILSGAKSQTVILYDSTVFRQ